MNEVLERLRLFKSMGMKNILVGCSGGVDSMALLHICKSFISENDMNIRAIHINHNAQPDNKQWGIQVADWCGELEIELISVELNIDYKSNFEEVARIARQNAIKGAIKEDEWFLTGHHANDQAENIIMALARSGGHSSLSGFDEISNINGYISAKPLLKLLKSDIYRYCQTKSIEFVEDSTNLESTQDRNFIRNEVIPVLERRWPNFVRNTNKSASLIKKLSNIIRDEVDGDVNHIHLGDLSNLSDRSEEVLRIWLKKRFGKSAGNNIVNQVTTLSKSSDGHSINLKGFTLGVWKNTVWDLRKKIVYNQVGNVVKFRKDLDSVNIGGINKKPKKVFKEFNIPPWERDDIPFFFDDKKLIAIGNQQINGYPVH